MKIEFDQFCFRQRPPYYGYALAWLDFWAGTLYWTAAMKYAFKIAPPTLVGTMAAMSGSTIKLIQKYLLRIEIQPKYC